MIPDLGIVRLCGEIFCAKVFTRSALAIYIESIQ